MVSKKKFISLSGVQTISKSSGFQCERCFCFPFYFLENEEKMFLVSLQVLILPMYLICTIAHFGWKSREKRGNVEVILKNRVMVTK